MNSQQLGEYPSLKEALEPPRRASPSPVSSRLILEPNPEMYLRSARHVLETEALALLTVRDRLDDAFNHAVELLRTTQGRVVACGMGKSGLVARKIAATLASIGVPSFFLHPADAHHGDLGMVTAQDVFLAVSYSGETEEVLRLLPFVEDNGNALIALSGNRSSTLARHATVAIDVSVESEACPHRMVPTASTTVALAVGDALAVALMHVTEFSQERFARLHPGGNLGRKLFSTAGECCHSDIPEVEPSASIYDVLLAISSGKQGLCLCRQSTRFIGIITDGDVRRQLSRPQAVFAELTAMDCVNRSPVFIPTMARLIEAERKMKELGLNVLVVRDEQGVVMGALSMKDV